MELYAAGFNAWGQLRFKTSENHAEPHDLHEFTCVLTGDAIERPRPSLSHTLVAVDGKVRTAGYLPTAHGVLCREDFFSRYTLAEASNGSVAVLDPTGSIRRYKSLDESLSHGQCQNFPQLPPCQQLVAYETGFAALTHSGDVYTFGDERYSACLGRETSPASPADEPGLVTALHDLPTGPIRKIAVGGYVLAALTTGDDLYIWGGHPGRKTVPADITDEPSPVDIEENDIADVAVGETHIIALTTSGDVFVIGDNGNGQLGLPRESGESWCRVLLDLKDDQRVVGVQAGARNSFLLVHEGSK
ncbi:regulator of chromosome condensation 1/beta-lactamase-inhibitor protein II [Diaporthe sp. PMI_573]|nr:regulator of chromosome condensation 1/beta-lactamase-inhibitor protein II [Diaporthaceae sp. PMI_573]